MPGLDDPHFFRHEWARLVATLVRVFGVGNLPLAEDVAQETLWRAMELWKVSGTPDDPSAWLSTVAKRRVIDALRRERTARAAVPELQRLLESEWTRSALLDEIFTPQPLRDDELAWMFALCQPRLPEATQVALVLQLACGFDVGEIAAAFLAKPDAIEKRLQRARKLISGSRAPSSLTADDVDARLPMVLKALYLLFNEGYHGASAQAVVREELCREALRLVGMLVAHPRTATPETLALAALLHLHAGRLPGRTRPDGHLRAWTDQDRTSWDAALIKEGLDLLDRAATGDTISRFHIEAAIAACHAGAASAELTPWAEIVRLYDLLMGIAPSSIVALSRAVALAQLEGPARGLIELRALDGDATLAAYPFYHGALGELTAQVEPSRARPHFQRALEVSRNPGERRFFEERLRQLPG